MSMSRRTLLVTGAAAGSAVAIPTATATADSRPNGMLRSDPFTLGVASGDPDHDGFVLWTRLAPQPLAADGMGGMPDRYFPVSWEVATEPRFRRRVRRGVAYARPESGHSVHVELSGLSSAHDYYYRFRVGGWVSPVGRARTAPRPWETPAALMLGIASCSQFEHGYFTAYRRIAEDEPDLILHLGDYQYEYTKDTYVSPDGNVRDHDGPETETLANYRQRHAQYKTDPDLRAAHAAAPWLVVFDDHELDNNWADMVAEKPDIPQPNFPERRAAAFQAYYENMPLRRRSLPDGYDMQLYRRIRWGRLANLHMLDTRQYRDDQACGDGYKDCAESDNPERSILGEEQEAWLVNGFHRSSARWDVLGQQVFFGQRDNTEGPVKKTSQDSWDGYTASRRRITEGWVDAHVRNPVVLTGDVHAHWASELKLDYDDPTTESVGVEFVGTSISSTGNGRDWIPEEHPFLQINPHLKFYNQQRGYLRARLTAQQMEVDYRVLPYVTEPDAECYTRATFVVADGDRTLHQTYDRPVDQQTESLMAELSDGEKMALMGEDWKGD